MLNKYKYFPQNKDELIKLVNNKKIKLSNIDISKVDDFSELFMDSRRYDFSGIENWNVSNVRNMSGMFSYAVEFNGNISLWDTSKVEDMSEMFEGAKYFNQNIGNWNVSKVMDMSGMFNYAVSFNQDISLWDTSCLENANFMFAGAKSFNQDISKWNISNLKYMTSMFNRADLFNQDLSCWNVSHAQSLAFMFFKARNFNQDLSSWTVSRECMTDKMFFQSGIAEPPFWYCNKEYYNNQNEKTAGIKDKYVPLTNRELIAVANNDDIPLKEIDVQYVSDFSNIFAYSERQDFSGIEDWNVSHVTDMTDMFCSAECENLPSWYDENKWEEYETVIRIKTDEQQD